MFKKNKKQSAKKLDINKATKHLDKLLDGMDDNDKKLLYQATLQAELDKTMKEQIGKNIQAGYETAYIHLFETYIQPISTQKLDNIGAQKLLSEMVEHINAKYAIYKINQVKKQTAIKDNVARAHKIIAEEQPNEI